MIERFIKNDLTLKRWRIFKKNKRAVICSWIILALTFLSFTAEFWANSKPIIFSYKSKTYFPIFKTYSVKDFGITDSLQVDYRSLVRQENSWAVWPLIKWDPFESNKAIDEYPGEPNPSNLLGTDDRGRDILTRILYGFRYSITFAVLVWFLNFLVGTILGGVMGYAGGKVDFFGQRLVEVFSTVPQFFLLIILIAVFQPSLILLIVISSIFGWIPISYYVRGEFLKNRRREFVEAAKAVGTGHFGIFFKHILPNSLGPIITFSPFAIAGNITALASLDYLGFGLTPPTPSWGELLAQAQEHFTTSWWLALFPALALFVTLVCLNLIGDGVRDALDPRKAN